MNFAEYSVSKPVTISMLVLSILALGLLSLERLPLALLPDISSNRLSVNVEYPSSSPAEVERDITRPLEEILSTLNHLESISSTSSGNSANVRLSFESGINMDLVALEVRDRLDQVRSLLPEDVERIRIWRWQSTDSPVFRFSVAWKGDRKELFNFVEDFLRPSLERIEGIANVDISGIDAKQVIIDLDPARLQAHGIDIFNLSQALRNNNLNLSGGYIRDGGKKYTLRTLGEFQTIEEIRDFPVQGARLTLGDLGDIRYDFPEKDSISRLNGTDSVSLRIYKASTANVVSVCRAVAAELERIQSSERYRNLVSIQVYQDQSQEITKSIRNLATSGLFGGALACIVLYLFLMKFRSTVIIALAIPVSVVFTFAFMFMLRVFGSDISINTVSLMGLMVAIGMLVDSSVVVLENIFRLKQEKGMGTFEAAIAGTKEVSVAVSASTATTVAVFVSFLFVEDGFSSRWLKDFGVSVGVALVAALVTALTLVPMLSSRIFTGQEKPKQRLLVGLTTGYRGLMAFMLRWRFVALVIMAVIGWSSYQLFSAIDRDLFPRVAEREARFSVLMERSFSLLQMEQLFEQLEKTLFDRKEEFEIETISSRFGNRTSRRGQYRGELTIFLVDENSSTSTQKLTRMIQSALPVVPGVEYQMGRMRHYGGGSDMGVEVRLKGDDPGILEVYGDLIKSRLMDIRGVRDVQTNLETGDDEIHLEVDRKKTEQFGISAIWVARTIASALSTRATTRIKGDAGEIDIILQMKGGNKISLQEVQNINFENRQGEMIPLSSVVSHQYRKGPRAIRREDRKATLTVVGNTDRGGMLMASMAVNEALAGLKFPAGYSWDLGRQWRRFRDSENASWFSIIMAVILMYIIMAALFESFAHPLTILFTVPFSIIGVAGLFYLTGTTLNQMAYLGILVLFGLVVNNGIILIDHINTLRNQGLRREAAVLQAGVDRLRPILMTACTSLFGLMPLTLPFIFPDFFGAVEGRSRMWAPVSLAVFGGLTTSTFLTLIILPTVYIYVDDVSRFGRRVVFRLFPALSESGVPTR